MRSIPLVLIIFVRIHGQRHAKTPPPKEAANPEPLPNFSYRPSFSSSSHPSASPTAAVSNVDSKSKAPSNSMTGTTSAVPTLGKRTHQPSMIHSISTSIVPSLVKSTQPTPTSSIPSPSKYGTPSPSQYPSLSIHVSTSVPSRHVTSSGTKKKPTSTSNHPTVYQTSKIQTLSPSIHPTLYTNVTNLCNTAISGMFGSLGSSSAYISYNYRIEVKNATRILDTLVHLEMAVNDALLPSLFPSTCGNFYKRALSNATIDETWTTQVVGISTFPSDIPSSDPCIGQVTSGAICYNVRGRLTLFLTIDMNASLFSTVNKVSQTVIQTSMDSGALVYSDVNILRVLYQVDANSNVISSENLNNTLNRGSPPIYGWVLLALIISLITAVLAIFSRRRRSLQNANQQDQDHSSLHSVHGDETIDSDLSLHSSGYIPEKVNDDGY